MALNNQFLFKNKKKTKKVSRTEHVALKVERAKAKAHFAHNRYNNMKASTKLQNVNRGKLILTL